MMTTITTQVSLGPMAFWGAQREQMKAGPQ